MNYFIKLISIKYLIKLTIFLQISSSLFLLATLLPQKSLVEASNGNDFVFELECLAEHNKWRSLHGVEPLVYDAQLTSYAKQRAYKIARSGYLWHTQGSKFGENLAWHSWTSTSCATLVKMWHDEVYRVTGNSRRQLLKQQNSNSFSMRSLISQAGHFTQLIWNSSKKLGCARTTGARGVYLVCLYDPPGNIISRRKDYYNYDYY